MIRPTLRLFLLVLFGTGCTSAPSDSADQLRVVATTSLVADVVSEIAGDTLVLQVLLPPEADPHTFEPSPREVALINKADLVFMNGLGLEIFMQDILDNVDTVASTVVVSEGIVTLEVGEPYEESNDKIEEEHGEVDPHVWMNPLNVAIWAQNIADALSQVDVQNEEFYQSNAAAYIADLTELDEWARVQLNQIPPESRILVTDHESFAYFAEHYGFSLVGALIQGYSTAGEPSAAELAALEEAVRDYAVTAIFVGVSINSALAEQVAEDSGVVLVTVYTESLSREEGQPTTYLEMIRYNIAAISNALK